jgi:hypothetical protein
MEVEMVSIIESDVELEATCLNETCEYRLHQWASA